MKCLKEIELQPKASRGNYLEIGLNLSSVVKGLLLNELLNIIKEKNAFEQIPGVHQSSTVAPFYLPTYSMSFKGCNNSCLNLGAIGHIVESTPHLEMLHTQAKEQGASGAGGKPPTLEIPRFAGSSIDSGSYPPSPG